MWCLLLLLALGQAAARDGKPVLCWVGDRSIESYDLVRQEHFTSTFPLNRHVFKWESVFNCTIIHGNILEESASGTNASSIEEITGSVYIYPRSESNPLASDEEFVRSGMDNLRVIRGEHDEYSKGGFEDIALFSQAINILGLHRIQAIVNGRVLLGGICYSEHYDWHRIMTRPSSEEKTASVTWGLKDQRWYRRVLVGENAVCDFALCHQSCNNIKKTGNSGHKVLKESELSLDPEQREKVPLRAYCSGQRAEDCFYDCDCYSRGRHCVSKADTDNSHEFASASSGCCHKECIGGCTKAESATDCSACSNMLDMETGECVQSCQSSRFILFGKYCVTEEACVNGTWGWVLEYPARMSHSGLLFESKSRRQCIIDIVKDADDRLQNVCPTGTIKEGSKCIECAGCVLPCFKDGVGKASTTYSVMSKVTLDVLADNCTLLNSRLSIEITHPWPTMEEDLDKKFRHVVNTTYGLCISSSSKITHLRFFRSLKNIGTNITSSIREARQTRNALRKRREGFLPEYFASLNILTGELPPILALNYTEMAEFCVYPKRVYLQMGEAEQTSRVKTLQREVAAERLTLHQKLDKLRAAHVELGLSFEDTVGLQQQHCRLLDLLRGLTDQTDLFHQTAEHLERSVDQLRRDAENRTISLSDITAQVEQQVCIKQRVAAAATKERARDAAQTREWENMLAQLEEETTEIRVALRRDRESYEIIINLQEATLGRMKKGALEYAEASMARLLKTREICRKLGEE